MLGVMEALPKARHKLHTETSCGLAAVGSAAAALRCMTWQLLRAPRVDGCACARACSCNMGCCSCSFEAAGSWRSWQACEAGNWAGSGGAACYFPPMLCGGACFGLCAIFLRHFSTLQAGRKLAWSRECFWCRVCVLHSSLMQEWLGCRIAVDLLLLRVAIICCMCFLHL